MSAYDLDGAADAYIFPLESQKLGRRSIDGFIVTVAAQILKTLLLAASTIIMSRLLTPTDFGLLAIIAPVTSFLALISNIGLFQALVQVPDLTQVKITSMFWISFYLGLILAITFLLIAPMLFLLYGDRRLVLISLFLSGTILVSSLASTQIALLNRLMAFRSLAFLEIASLVAATCASIAMARSGWGYWALVAGQITSACLTTLFAWLLSPWRPSAFTLNLPAVRGMLNFGRNLTISNVGLYLNASLDNILVAYVLGENALGVYDRAWKLAVMPLGQLIAPIDRIALPALSRLRQDDERYRIYFSKMIQVMLFCTTPGLVAAIFSAQTIFPILLGHQWQDLVPVFQWLCVGGIVSPINAAVFWLFISQGRSEAQVKFTIVAIAINIAAYSLGLVWGLEGVTRTSALSVYLLQCPILVWGGCRCGPVSMSDMLRALIAPGISLASTSTLCAAFWILLRPGSLLYIVSFFGFAYTVGCLSLFCTATGRAFLNEAKMLVRFSFLKTRGSEL